MKHYKLNDKPFTCPESWEEITLEQLLKIDTGITRSMETIVICTGIPEEEWNKSNDLKLIEEIAQDLAFVRSAEGLDYGKKPSKFVFNGVEVSALLDIGNLSIGQYQDLLQEVTNFHNETDTVNQILLYPKITSIYLQPFVTKSDYDWVKAEEISKELYHHSAMEVCAWGAFFIVKFKELRNGIMKDVQKLGTLQNKRKPGLVGYLKSLVGRRRSTV